jgi:hypothetical protein
MGRTNRRRDPARRAAEYRKIQRKPDWQPQLALSHCEVTSKLRYQSEADAKRALDDIRTRNSARRHEKKLYVCPFCDGWHLTSQRPR